MLLNELQTERLFFKRLSENDFERIKSIHNDPSVMKIMSREGERTDEELKKLLDLMLYEQENYGLTLCPNFEKCSGEFIGFSGLIHLELDDSNADIEVGYWLLPKFWGKGYATELTKALVAWGFNHLTVERIVGITHPEHIPSQSVLKKSGFHLVGSSTYRGVEVVRFEINNNRVD